MKFECHRRRVTPDSVQTYMQRYLYLKNKKKIVKYILCKLHRGRFNNCFVFLILFWHGQYDTYMPSCVLCMCVCEYVTFCIFSISIFEFAIFLYNKIITNEGKKII